MSGAEPPDRQIGQCCYINGVKTPEPVLAAEHIDRLRTALVESRYTQDEIEATTGKPIHEVVILGNAGKLSEIVQGIEPQSLLIRLFLDGALIRESDAELCHGLPVHAMTQAALLEEVEGDYLRAKVRIQPHRKWWVLSDLPPRRHGYAGHDAVLGVEFTARCLARYTLRDKVDTALDIGTGGGVQALHLAEHAAKVTATDLSYRALEFAATTAALNDVEWELLHGDLVEPVQGRRFDLVVSNMPVSVGPGLGRWLYRDSSEPGDALVTRLAAAAPDLLNDGGVMQFMAHWPEHAGRNWQDYLATWMPAGFDAWITRDGSASPEDYVEAWLGDSPDDDVIDRRQWLQWLEDNNVESIGKGMVTLRRSDQAVPAIRIEHSTPIPAGVDVARWITGRDWVRDQDWRDHAYRLADGAVLQSHGKVVGMAGTLSKPFLGGFWRWVFRNGADNNLVEMGLDGRFFSVTGLAVQVCANASRVSPRRLGDLLDELERRSGADPVEFRREAVETVTRLLERGILEPATLS